VPRRHLPGEIHVAVEHHDFPSVAPQAGDAGLADSSCTARDGGDAVLGGFGHDQSAS